MSTWNKRVFLWARPSYWVDTGVVYYFRGQTGRFTVWTNSGLINFVEEWRLPFVQISFIPTKKRPRRRETGVKDGFELKWNTNFRLEHSVRKNRTTLSDVPLLPDIFRRKDAKSRVPGILVNLRLCNRRRWQTLCEKRDKNFVWNNFSQT